MKNLTLLTDLYQLTMMQGYFKSGFGDKEVVFDMFYRKNPYNGGYAICAGLEQVIEYIKELHFDKEDIQYLRSLNIFEEDFLGALKEFRFTGDIYAIPEGTVIFPNEPILRVHSTIMEAQYIETAILNIINHQSLIATKASRVRLAAQNDRVLEFGLRRAQGPDAGVYGARAAIIGGCNGTSDVLAGQIFDVPISGTHAHSWVMSFDSELEAFRTYANIFPQAAILLVDTYDTLTSGVPNAIKIFDEMREQGKLTGLYGIRLDSGDLAYLSKKARRMLDAAGHEEAIISASSDLDENLITDLKLQGAKITLWGVGTRLITSEGWSAFGGVYKIVACKDKYGDFIPKIKLSDNAAKVTNPGIKKVVRCYDTEHHKIKVDLIALDNEKFDESQTIIASDHNARWKKMTLHPGQFTLRELLVPIFQAGACVYDSPTILEIAEYAKSEMNTLWEEHLRFINPEIMPVDLSDKLYLLKNDMLKNFEKGL
ncbi:MAG: nicotinate phosphoribosyltransferase [Candidatus Epulonipiscioides saccharophilum]|nr:MAG: nicotinate phosphoribosyltransferase [Epulopiscium sp. AS2M-Bin001]